MKTYFKIIAWIGVFLGAILLAKILLWPIFFAGQVVSTGQAVVSKTIDPTNVIVNYERFHDLYANYSARIGQIRDHAKFLALEPDPSEKSRLRIEVAAIRQSCRSLVTQYNQDSEKINRNLFKGTSLPASLDLQSCEE